MNKLYSLLGVALVAGLGAITVTNPASAAYDGSVRIGVLTDLSGPYSALSGEGAIAAVKMAVDDCLKAECKGMKIEVLTADHQNKPDVASGKAREWIDQNHVDMIVDLTNSGVALAVQKVGQEKGVLTIGTGPATSALTNDACSPVGLHWMYDTYALAKGTAVTVTKQGGDSWFFVTVDYAFGQALEKDSTKFIEANGGKVVGSVKHPLNAPDFSSYLLQAQASKAKVIGLANTAADLVNAVKAAREYGIVDGGQRIASLLVFLTDVNAMGLETAQGLTLTEGFYWDMDDQAREFSKRFAKVAKGVMPSMVQAADYSATMHYLRAVNSIKNNDSKAVVAEMRRLPINDPVMRHASIREDGRVIHDMYLFQVKKPSESKYAWDDYKTLATIPAAEAFRPLSESSCPLVKK